MKKLFFILLTTYSLMLHAQIGKVGINTTTPQAMLHVKDSSVLFAGLTTLPFLAGNPPVSGAGVRMMWYPDKAAFRTGWVFSDNWDKNNVGTYSFAAGYNVKASGNNGATALGYFTIAGGNEGATALGYSTTAGGSHGATSLGYITEAGGSFGASALGSNTKASGDNGATALGYFTTASGHDGATALGYFTTASGHAAATALGSNTKASGDNGATALGRFAVASGHNGATALGYFTTANGSFGATSLGRETTASGNNGATAMGYETYAKSFASIAIGMFNDSIAAGSNTTYVATDPLFIIGNGTANNARRNAFIVAKNAETGINVANGMPQAMLHIKAREAAFDMHIRLENFSNSEYANILYDGSMKFRTFGADDEYQWRTFDNDTRMILGQTGNLTIDGTLSQNSDARLKKNIHPIQNSLKKIFLLNGYHYNWIDNNSDQSLQTGLLAQELEKQMPELVNTNKEGIKSVNYSGVIPYLLEAIKEQQKMIEILNRKIEKLERTDKPVL